jgi:PKD repeat protein
VVHVAWDFGDGTTCPGSAGACGAESYLRPIHCYAAPGSYMVTLIILDEEGAIGRIQREILLLE